MSGHREVFGRGHFPSATQLLRTGSVDRTGSLDKSEVVRRQFVEPNAAQAMMEN